MDPFIAFDDVSKSFANIRVIDRLNLAIGRGEFVSLLGPSGSGKTTILMILAGFLSPTSGRVLVDGRRIDHLPPHKRDMGVVFQSYALFPHMTVADNVAFPLRMRRAARDVVESKVGRALDMVQLAHLKERRPAQLSGGQQQRVALARALVFEPAVVLMDEPLGALDKQLREQMQLDIRELHRRLGLTIVFVTHDQGEALTMSDRIAVFNHGRIDHIGAPIEVYDRPATRFVAEFIGETNLLEGRVEASSAGETLVRLGSGEGIAVAGSEPHAAGKEVLVSVRPERIAIAAAGQGEGNELAATVADSVYQGDHQRIQLRSAAGGLVLRTDRRGNDWPRDAPVSARFLPSDCWIIPR